MTEEVKDKTEEEKTSFLDYFCFTKSTYIKIIIVLIILGLLFTFHNLPGFILLAIHREIDFADGATKWCFRYTPFCFVGKALVDTVMHAALVINTSDKLEKYDFRNFWEFRMLEERSKASTSYFIDYIDSGKYSEKHCALSLLLFLNPEDSRIEEALIDLISEEQDEFNEFAILGLGKVGALTGNLNPKLIEIVKNSPKDSPEYYNAMWAIQDIGIPNDEITPILEDDLRSNDKSNRHMAAITLSIFFPEDADLVPTLLEIYQRNLESRVGIHLRKTHRYYYNRHLSIAFKGLKGKAAERAVEGLLELIKPGVETNEVMVGNVYIVADLKLLTPYCKDYLGLIAEIIIKENGTVASGLLKKILDHFEEGDKILEKVRKKMKSEAEAGE